MITKQVVLLINIPVNSSEGMTKGRTVNTCPPPKGKSGTWVKGDCGPVKLMGHEYERIEE